MTKAPEGVGCWTTVFVELKITGPVQPGSVGAKTLKLIVPVGGGPPPVGVSVAVSTKPLPRPRKPGETWAESEMPCAALAAERSGGRAAAPTGWARAPESAEHVTTPSVAATLRILRPHAAISKASRRPGDLPGKRIAFRGRRLASCVPCSGNQWPRLSP